MTQRDPASACSGLVVRMRTEGPRGPAWKRSPLASDGVGGTGVVGEAGHRVVGGAPWGELTWRGVTLADVGMCICPSGF